jgi:predicted thioredoxin/glutaredoxin
MKRSEKVLNIIRSLEQFQAELLMEGAQAYLVESTTVALNELYWLYRDIAADELD